GTELRDVVAHRTCRQRRGGAGLSADRGGDPSPADRRRTAAHQSAGATTAAIFFTCAVHHGGHVVHMLLPYGHVERAQGLALRASYDWEAAVWDIVTAAVGVYYWTLRRAYAQMVRGAALFEDMRQREREALELNDRVLQGMVVARM